MVGKTNRYRIYEVDHSLFGGIIYPSDFQTNYSGRNKKNGSSIAERIKADKKFDKLCENNIKNRK